MYRSEPECTGGHRKVLEGRVLEGNFKLMKLCLSNTVSLAPAATMVGGNGI